MDTSQYITLFVEESREHLARLTQFLSEAEPQSSFPDETLQEMFRSAHTLKGMAASMGYADLAELTHRLEDGFAELRASSGPALSSAFLDAALETADFFERALDDIVKNGAPQPPPAELIQKLIACAGKAVPVPGTQTASPEKSADSSEARDPKTESPSVPDLSAPTRYQIRVQIDPADPLPSARAMVALKTIETLGTVEAASPTVELLTAGKCDGLLTLTLASRRSASEIEEKLKKMPSLAQFHVEVKDEAPSPSSAVSPSSSETQDDKKVAESGISSIRVSVEHLDNFFNFASEFMVQEGRIDAALDSDNYAKIKTEFERLKRRVHNFYDDVTKVRLVNFDTISPRLRRVVRDTARFCKKTAHFEILGEEAKMDRSVLDELFEPLSHVLRNSVDHGIEAPSVRKAKGKSSEGHIRLTVKRKGEHVCVEAEDDGPGMDPRKIKQAAMEKGYLARSDADALSDQDALLLCTLPGFSTRRDVSAVSGRGVGMDVVRTKVESLGGHLFLASRPGHGTRVTLWLPLSMSIFQAFLIEAKNEVYAVPVRQVQRTMQVDPSMIRRVQNRDMVLWGDETLPFYRLGALLDSKTRTVKTEACPALIVSKHNKPYALSADRICGTSEIVVKPLGEPMEEVRRYSGAALLGDGRMALVLDPENLI